MFRVTQLQRFDSVPIGQRLVFKIFETGERQFHILPCTDLVDIHDGSIKVHQDDQLVGVASPDLD